MKIFGLTAGRPHGNSELMLRAALEVCENEFGADVSWINVRDHDIEPCTGCEKCLMNSYKTMEYPRCIFDGKDDMKEIMTSELVPADGIIFSVPVYGLAIPGVLKSFFDRMLPWEMPNLVSLGIMDRIPDRVAGIMTVGGATSTWMGMAQEQVHYYCTTQCINVVDKYSAIRITRPGQVLIHDDVMERAKQLGRNIAQSARKPSRDLPYLGDTSNEMCPVCHSNLIRKASPHWDGISFEYECALCGAGGSLTADEHGRVSLKLAENGLVRCRLWPEGRADHIFEIQAAHKEAEDNADRIRERLAEALQYQPRKF